MLLCAVQPAALRVTFTGDGGHAGGQLMAVRNDAGLAAAELSLHVETATLATGVAIASKPFACAAWTDAMPAGRHGKRSHRGLTVA